MAPFEERRSGNPYGIASGVEAAVATGPPQYVSNTSAASMRSAASVHSQENTSIRSLARSAPSTGSVQILGSIASVLFHRANRKARIVVRDFIWEESKVVKHLRLLERGVAASTDDKTRPWINSTSSAIVFGIIIVLSSFSMGVDLHFVETGNERGIFVMAVLDSCFLLAFWIEIALRVKAAGWGGFVRDYWGPFDVILALLGSIDSWILFPLMGSARGGFAGVMTLKVLRLSRVIRMLRMVRLFRELALLTKVMVKSFRALLWIGLFLLFLVYLSSIMCFAFITEGDLQAEGISALRTSLVETIFLHMRIITAEGYIDSIVYPTWKLSWVWVVYWIVGIVALHIFMLNLVLGLLVQKTMKDVQEMDRELATFVRESEQFHNTLWALFRRLDTNSDGKMDAEEIDEMLNGSLLADILKSVRIHVDVPRNFLMTMFGFPRLNAISFEQFYKSCLRICGSQTNVRSMMLQLDIEVFKQDMLSRVRICRRKLRRATMKGGLVREAPSSPTTERRTVRELKQVMQEFGGEDEHEEEQQDTAISRIALRSAGVRSEAPSRFATPVMATFSTASDGTDLSTLSPLVISRSPRGRSPRGNACDVNAGGVSPPVSPRVMPAWERRHSRTSAARTQPPASGAGDPGDSVVGAFNKGSHVPPLRAEVEGFFPHLLSRARRRLTALEHQQEELLAQLQELRFGICGAVNCVAPKCPQGHYLLPLGTTDVPTGRAEYKHWTCDGAKETGGCTGVIGTWAAASHLTPLRRFHCGRCHYDICERCYHGRLAKTVREERIARQAKLVEEAVLSPPRATTATNAVTPSPGSPVNTSPSPAAGVWGPFSERSD